MKLIAGLGNPGTEYQQTLHNAGFIIVDKLAERLQLPKFQKKNQGEIIRSTLASQSFILLKPQTFMNLSGKSLTACARYYQIPNQDIVVISDDVDLVSGKVRFRLDGGHGGHNGLRSIIEYLGSKDFKRIRIGIGRPDGKTSVRDFVLSKWEKTEFSLFEEICVQVVDHLIQFIKTSEFENTSLSL